MACVAHNSLVEVVGRDDETSMTFVQNLRVGDWVRDARTHDYDEVVSVTRQNTGGVWPMYAFLGLTADAVQWVHRPPSGWVLIAQVGVPVILACPAIYSVVLGRGGALRVDGVTCCTSRCDASSLSLVSLSSFA